jgi:hypothetical protein
LPPITLRWEPHRNSEKPTPHLADTNLYVETCSKINYFFFEALWFMNWCLTSAEMGAEAIGNAAEGLLTRIDFTAAALERIGRLSQFSSFAIELHKS